ncbi:MAG: GAF and ANTAR domain-containing protein [Nakamurella sp.]
MASPERSHEILAKLIVQVAAAPMTLPSALCASCAEDLPMTGAAMVLQSSAGLDRVVAATDGLAVDVEHLQFELGEGPGVDAVRQDGPVLRSELRATTSEWPLFAPAAVSAGVEAAFAFPLHVGGIRLGVLDLYRDTPGGLLDGLLSEALAYADAATAVLLHLQALSRPSGDLHPQLTGFSADRAEIHQATGMISAQAGVTLVDALLLLRARAYSTNRTMLAVSRDVLDRRERFYPDGESADA